MLFPMPENIGIDTKIMFLGKLDKNQQYIKNYKNCYRQNIKNSSPYVQDNMSGKINVEFEPCSSKTVGGDRFRKIYKNLGHRKI